jgi:uncharacterized protein (UPF0264 family)
VKLLVSVIDAAEARLAVAGGVDIVDVKNPAEGSLGAPAPGVIADVRDVLPAELPLSAAIGDLPCLPGSAALAALGAARSGAAYVKLGLWGASRTEDAVAVLRAVRDAVDGDAAVIAVGYADAARVPSRPLPAAQLVAVARRAGVSGCLIDTAIKDGRGLLSWIAADALAELVAEAHGAGLEMALAGELRAEELLAVRATGADIAGVRSAACREGRRTAALDPLRVEELRALCAVAGERRPSVLDGSATVDGEADDPVGDIERQQHVAVPALELPRRQEVGGQRGQADEHREVPVQDVGVDHDGAAGEHDDAELAGD